VEFAVTCFYDGQRFRSEVCYLNQEEKKLLDGGKGSNTGQMGEIGFCIPDARLFQETLAKLEPWLADKRYIGYADCNCIVGPDFLVPLELSIARPGYPTLYSWLEMLAEPAGEWLLRMCRQDGAPIKTHAAVNCTLVLATGSFPEPDETQAKLAVLNGLKKTGLEHVWLCEVRYADGKFRGAGTMGYLAVITNKGGSIPKAARNVYDVIDQLSVVPYEIYRMDIGMRAMQEFGKLDIWGWLQ
jgi:phosphoribosylamine-glycine ligase